MRQVTFVFMLKVTNANDSLLIIKSGQDQLERKGKAVGSDFVTNVIGMVGR